MFRQVSTQRFVDRSRVVERTRDIGFQEHDVGTLSVAPVVLPSDTSAQVVLRPHVVFGKLYLSTRHDGASVTSADGAPNDRIKLSDLEAANFGIVWVLTVGLLVFSVAEAAERTVEYGMVLAVVMYVFEFAESVTLLPFYYQQWLRLREISGRLTAVTAAA